MKHKTHLILFSDLSLCGLDDREMEEERQLADLSLNEYEILSIRKYENCAICSKVLNKLTAQIRESL